MPELRKESLGGGDFRWLASAHGIRNCRSSVLDVSAFTKATHYPDGYFRSGTPVNVADEKAAKPWTGAAGEVLGFVFGDVATDGVEDPNAPVFRHGGINLKYVPVTADLPTAAPAGYFFVTGV